MKKFFARHSKLLGFMLGTVLSLILVGGGALAYTSYQTSTTFTAAVGSITIVAPPVTPDYDYTLSTNVLTFNTFKDITTGSSDTLIAGDTVGIWSQEITITNTGNQPIKGVNLTMVTPPAGLFKPTAVTNGSIVTIPGTEANNYSFVVIISGKAPTAGTFDLSGFTCTITPY